MFEFATHAGAGLQLGPVAEVMLARAESRLASTIAQPRQFFGIAGRGRLATSSGPGQRQRGLDIGDAVEAVEAGAQRAAPLPCARPLI